MNSIFLERRQGFLKSRSALHSVEWRLKSGVTPASSSSQCSIGVTSTATVGPKPDAAFLRFHAPAPPSSSTAADSFLSGCCAIVAAGASRSAAMTSDFVRGTIASILPDLNARASLSQLSQQRRTLRFFALFSGTFLRHHFSQALFSGTHFSQGTLFSGPCCATIVMSPFVQDRNVPLIRPPKGGRIGADRDEQGGVAKGGSAGACAEQASADCRCQQALAGELPAGKATVESISGRGQRGAKAS